MSIFSKKVWKDFIAEYPNRRKIKNVATQEEQVVEVQLDVGTIQENGDKWAMTPMNDLEDRIDQAFSDIEGTVAYYADNAAVSAEEAASSSISARNRQYEAEAWAIGTKNEIPVTSEDDQYQNNAKYYAQQASSSASSASSSKTDAATYANQASNYASNAETYKNNAQTSATNAQQSNVSAGSKALVAEGFANGEQDGIPVSSDSPYYHNNAKYFKEIAEQTIGSGLATTEHPGLVKVGEGLEIEPDGTLNVDFSPSDKMDKTNPRGNGSFAMNQEDETAIGVNAFIGGGVTRNKSSSQYTQGSCALTFESETPTTVTFDASIDLTAITDIEINRISMNDWKYFDVEEITETNITILKDDTISDYSIYNSINAVYHYGLIGNKASGTAATAFGAETVASGTYSFVAGEKSNATGSNAVALGSFNEALGDCSVAIGADNTASSYGSVAEGYSNESSGIYSVALGNDNTASQTNSVAIGYKNTASNSGAVAIGYQNTASGWCATAEGYLTTASGNSSFATGNNTKATGSNSFAEGYNTEAKGQSHAQGMGTIANGDGQHVEGMYNVEDTENEYLHIIGNGTDSNNRSNAMTVDRQGNTWTAGKYSFGDNKVVGDEHETKLVEDYWGQEVDFDDRTNYFKNIAFNRIISDVIELIEGTSIIDGIAKYDVPNGYLKIGFECSNIAFLNTLVGKTLEFGAINYEYTTVCTNQVVIQYRVSGGSYQYLIPYPPALWNTGSTLIEENIDGLALRFTVPENITDLNFYYLSWTHTYTTGGTMKIGYAYLFDVDAYPAPDRNNTYIKMKRINTSTLTNLDPNTLYFNKLDKKLYFTNNIGEVIAFGGSDTPPEIAISTTEPTGNEILWINPNDYINSTN